MIDGLRRYRETKLTGQNWLTAIPAHWEFHRAKRTFCEVDERSVRGDEELLSVSHITGVTPRNQKNVTMFMAESYEGHKLCRPADLVVNTMWAWMAAVGVSRQVGIVSPSYGVYRPRVPSSFMPRFLDYLLRTEAYRAEYVRASRGITTSRLRLYPEDFLGIPFVQPPIEEQRLIARFLDAHGALTARLIRAKQRLIKLLEEQKQAIIHRALTRGLDPNARLKPSGIPWLGDIPESWEVKRLKAICRFVYGDSLPSQVRARGNVNVFGSNGNVGTHTLANTRGPCIIIGRKGSFGKINWSDQAVFAIDTTYFIDEMVSVSNLRWLYHMLVWLRLDDLSKDSAIPGLAREDAYNRLVVTPNDVAEQTPIANVIDAESRELTEAIDCIQQEIRLVLEFRSRLVADVVTGQLDVRQAASALPEITEFEPIDEPTGGEGFEEAFDDVEKEEVAA